jgi:hypothetical protein
MYFLAISAPFRRQYAAFVVTHQFMLDRVLVAFSS